MGSLCQQKQIDSLKAMLKESESKIQSLRKQQKDLPQLEKSRARFEEDAKRLQTDISKLKTQRVDLVRRMVSESKVHQASARGYF